MFGQNKKITDAYHQGRVDVIDELRRQICVVSYAEQFHVNIGNGLLEFNIDLTSRVILDSDLKPKKVE